MKTITLGRVKSNSTAARRRGKSGEAPRARRLQLENLESRELLAVAALESAALVDAPPCAFTEDYADVDVDGLAPIALPAALDAALDAASGSAVDAAITSNAGGGGDMTSLI